MTISLNAPKNKKKILVVDDSALMRRVMCDIINSDERFQVIEQAIDGEKAYELLKKNTYDGVVLDVNMPKMDGIQLLQMLQKDKIRARIMMASTDTKEGASVTMEALELGAIDFIEKPANILYLRGNDFKTRFLDILKAVVSSPQTNIPRESAVSIKKSEESTRKLVDIVRKDHTGSPWTEACSNCMFYRRSQSFAERNPKTSGGACSTCTDRTAYAAGIYAIISGKTEFTE